MSWRNKVARQKRIPEGWDLLEPTLEEFEQTMREAGQSPPPTHTHTAAYRHHPTPSRLPNCADLAAAVDDPHDGKRKCESQWDIHRIHWKKNRFIYDMYYKDKKITKELYDWLCRMKIADQPLISKWRKPGYEILCSMLAISQSSTNFGTVSVCRVPMRQRGGGVMPAVTTGCVSCASGDGLSGAPPRPPPPAPPHNTRASRRLCALTFCLQADRSGGVTNARILATRTSTGRTADQPSGKKRRRAVGRRVQRRKKARSSRNRSSTTRC